MENKEPTNAPNKLEGEELEKVSTLFSELTLSLSSRYPAKVFRPETNTELTDREVEIINVLKQYSPKQVTDAVFRRPPTVVAYDENSFDKSSGTGPTVRLNPGRLVFYKATPNDLEYSEKDVPSPAGSMGELFQSGIKVIKNHLKAPAIRDNFEDHKTQRAPWEKGITNALDALDSVADSGKSKQDYKDLGHYAKEFRHKFNNNRLGGTRGQVLTSLKTMAVATANNPPVQDKIYEYVRRWNAIPKDSVITHSLEVTNLAKEAFDYFSSQP